MAASDRAAAAAMVLRRCDMFDLLGLWVWVRGRSRVLTSYSEADPHWMQHAGKSMDSATTDGQGAAGPAAKGSGRHDAEPPPSAAQPKKGRPQVAIGRKRPGGSSRRGWGELRRREGRGWK